MKKPKHVIWISTDHMRYDCIGAYGNSAMHTPNLDYLVSRGANFHRCYTQNPVCMPSRASFFSGLYPQQTGITENGFCLPDDFTPLASHEFKGLGYDTGHIGKLHLQPHDGHAYESKPRNTYGFDTFWNSETLGSLDDAYTRYLKSKYPEYHQLHVRTAAHKESGAQWSPRVLDAPFGTSHSGWVASASVDYLGMRGWNPQFLHLGFFAPHPPLIPTQEAFSHYENVKLPLPKMADEEWNDKPDRLARMLKAKSGWSLEQFQEYQRYFYALVTEVDMAVGQVLDKLRKRNDLDSTLIVFCSDHGDMCGDHRLTLKGPHFFDEVMHVPCVFHWPEGLGTDQTDIDALTEMTDLLPTMVELCGGTPDRRMSGRSYAADLLAGKEPDGRADVLAYHHPGYIMLRSDEYKYLRYGEDQEVLYDLSEPEHEVHNRAGRKSHRGALEAMRSRALTRMIDASFSPRERLTCW